ncbi:preprotein translocase SecY subunit [Gordonia hirsuta DSM 44140 = NBRC 16056]|uniref:Protein translocase subunit SecY n=1 Tax=Gordonia hirsuta DSM 44140 = NBRC 16056 TaxID=1121927 RepID=L7L633_9ACTN|nr:preprotein translocase subunit SecY [Gordonia hirsuta]GAC56409.1 preprotein translocase SecY subunit [Gordonia hirsuta DSM 44140 = NBRC 16056]
MLSSLVATFRTPDLRKKIVFVLGILVLYRFGATLPSPGVDFRAINDCVDAAARGDSAQIYSLINMFSGGALLQLSVFAIGIMPYITASIIVQLLTVVIPRFEQLRKEGQSGQAKMTQYTRYLTVALALLQSTGIVALAASGSLFPTSGAEGCDPQAIVRSDGIMELSLMVLVMTAGATLVMWFGELITERGVGNGMSLLIFAGIAARLPAEGRTILQTRGGLVFGLVCLAVLIILLAVVFIEQGQRRVPVQYAKRMVGRKMYGGSSTYIPIKVNTAGVIPVIFASSLLYIPQLIISITQGSADVSGWQLWIQDNLVNPGSWVHIAVYFLLIIFFTYFYVAVTFNPEERADDMKRYGGFIPGIRPGKPTADYLSFVLSRITLPGSLYLGIIAILPNLFLEIGNSSSVANLPFGGTALLIMVAVGLDTLKQINSQLMQRKYEGFLK